MNGQVKAVIPALIGIVPLLLAGITGYVNSSGGQQATAIAETRAITLETDLRQKLATAFRADAESAAMQVSDSVAADLAIELRHRPSQLVAASAGGSQERG
jgi:hypothetical protein